MQNKKEFVSGFIKKQKDCEFSFRFLLQKEDDVWKIFFTMLELVKKGTRKEVDYDYGEYVLKEKLLDIEEGLGILQSLYGKNGEKGKLIVSNYDEFVIDSGHQLKFAPSKPRYGMTKRRWPMWFCTFRVPQGRVGKDWNRELLKEGFPYYPDLNEAIIGFFGLTVEHFSSYGEVRVIATDYRARIESLRLLFSKAKLELYSPEIEYENLVVKVFAKSARKMVTLPDIHPKSESVGFDIGFQPDSLYVALLSLQDNMKIDGMAFSKWSVEEEGVFIERPEEEILSLTRAGESQNLEYKYDVVDDNNKNDFIESVIAFLNTNTGIILIGVDNSGNIVGSKKSIEAIQKIIHDSCDPPPRSVKVQEKEISGKKVIIVEISEGDDKPYQSRRDRNFYVRHNSTDMKMERSELSRILKEQTEQSRVPPM